MSAGLLGLPATDGFRMPAEWEPHSGCWMLWPEQTRNWRNGAKPAQLAFAAVAEAIANAEEPVTVGASARQYEHARTVLDPAIRVVEMSSDDAWMRDTGPTFVVNADGDLRGVDWQFNAYGGLYAPFDSDDLVASKVLDTERCGRYRAPIVLEGGSIHVDGQGTCLVTEQCLLSPGRNRGHATAKIEAVLRDYLGVEKIIWLGKGVHADVTEGHVDNLACFTAPGEVCLTWCEDRDDPQHAISLDALGRLEAASDARGRRLTVHKLPSPGSLTYSQRDVAGIDPLTGAEQWRLGRRMPASYVNFYIANGAVVVPLLDDRTDAEALHILSGLFSTRRIVGIPGREILLGGGNIHCITQQVPASRLGTTSG